VEIHRELNCSTFFMSATVALTLQDNSEYHYFRQQCESIFIHFCAAEKLFFILILSLRFFRDYTEEKYFLFTM
jgi:hypothetical protein